MFCRHDYAIIDKTILESALAERMRAETAIIKDPQKFNLKSFEINRGNFKGPQSMFSPTVVHILKCNKCNKIKRITTET